MRTQYSLLNLIPIYLWLVDLTPSSYYSCTLLLIIRLMIPWQSVHFLSIVSTHNSPRIPHISHETSITNHQYHNGTWTTALDFIFRLSHLKEPLLSLHESLLEGLSRVHWEARLSHHELMQVVSQELST